MPWLPDEMPHAPLAFDILRHCADELVISDSRLQRWSRAVGGHSSVSSCAPPHEDHG